MNKKDIRLDLLRKIEINPQYTQRELSKEMGVSLGKINYCIKKLAEKGLIKITNFKRNPNKVEYLYLLTPKGIEVKASLTYSFLKMKIEEYEVLKNEITKLKEDVKKLGEDDFVRLDDIFSNK
jgi:EPS-associated MarR family transcriptional regulator